MIAVNADNLTTKNIEDTLNMHGWGYWAENTGIMLGYPPQPMFKEYRAGWRKSSTAPAIDHEYALALDHVLAHVCVSHKGMREILILRYVYQFPLRQIASIAKCGSKGLDHRRVGDMISGILHQAYGRLAG